MKVAIALGMLALTLGGCVTDQEIAWMNANFYSRADVETPSTPRSPAVGNLASETCCRSSAADLSGGRYVWIYRRSDLVDCHANTHRRHLAGHTTAPSP